MATRTTRQAARERILRSIAAAIEKLIPLDESIPLKGAIFADFEDQVIELSRTVMPVVLEERAALAENAAVSGPGRCPHCGSENVRLEKTQTQPELRSPLGCVAIPRQHARCRKCGRSFSPSGT